jgi:aspartyl-tRNA(Asn)/glutamyl-tRNA(Gln) amidotransferase subunit C
LDRTTLDHLAALARLSLSEDEKEQAITHLSRILGYFESLAALDTGGVEPSPYPFPLQNRSRPDDPGPSLPQDAALANAPEKAEGFYRVPRIVEG